MDQDTAAELTDSLADLAAVKHAEVFYVDGGRIYESMQDYDPANQDWFEVEITPTQKDIVPPAIVAVLAEYNIGFVPSLVTPGTIRTRSQNLPSYQ